MTDFRRPDWIPKVPDGTRILITGASGGLGSALVALLLEGSDCVIGAHGASKETDFSGDRIIPLQRAFEAEADCAAVVDEFTDKAGGIDALVATGAQGGQRQYDFRPPKDAQPPDEPKSDRLLESRTQLRLPPPPQFSLPLSSSESYSFSSSSSSS